MGERRGIYRVLVGKPEGKRPLGRPRCRWEDNIKMDLQEVGCGGEWLKIGTVTRGIFDTKCYSPSPEFVQHNNSL
jgi:hypothetical protein